MPLQCRKAFNLLAREANWIASPQQHLADIIFSSSTGRSFAQATKACICGSCVIVWAPVSIGGLAIRIQDKSIRDHHGPWRGPRAACQPVALPRCSGSSLPRVPLRSASPLRRSPFPVRGHGLGPDPSRHAPSSERRTTSTSVGLNLDISQLSKICPSRRNIIFMVNDEKTALLPQAAATKSIRPLWGNPVPRTERHRPSFCSGFASPSSCPSARPSRWQQS